MEGPAQGGGVAGVVLIEKATRVQKREPYIVVFDETICGSMYLVPFRWEMFRIGLLRRAIVVGYTPPLVLFLVGLFIGEGA